MFSNDFPTACIGQAEKDHPGGDQRKEAAEEPAL
jgi:hypothetical protein